MGVGDDAVNSGSFVAVIALRFTADAYTGVALPFAPQSYAAGGAAGLASGNPIK